MDYGVSRHIDEFSCEGEARVRASRSGRSMSDLLDQLFADGGNDILKGYEPAGKTNGYVLGNSKLEYKISDSFLVDAWGQNIGKS